MKGVITALLIVASTAAIAQERMPTWKLADESLVTVESDKQLKSKMTVLKQRLIPRKLAILNDDAERDDGKDRWAKKGDLLFGAMVDCQQVFCVLESKADMGSVFSGMAILSGRSSDRILKQDCFLDQDGDGKFDRRYKLDPGIGVLPNVSDDTLADFWPLRPASFDLVEPERFDEDTWIEIRFSGKTEHTNRFDIYRDRSWDDVEVPTLEIRYRYDGKTRGITNRVRAIGELPQTVEILGSQIELSQDNEGRLFARVLKNMDADLEVSVTTVRI